MTAARKKRWFRMFGVGCLALAVVVLALPVWFPWLLRPVLARFGVAFVSYERIGYTRFALTQVRGEFPGARFSGERVEGFLPPRWLWRRYASSPGEDAFLTVAGWRIDVEPGRGGRSGGSSGAPDSTFAVIEEIGRVLPAVRAWIPVTHWTDGRIAWGSNAVLIAQSDWRGGRLTTRLKSLNPPETILLDGDFSGGPGYDIGIEAEPLGMSGRVRLSRGRDLWQGAGELRWEGNRVELEAVFGSKGWWPKKAALKSDHFRVPARVVALDGYDDPTGSFELDWRDEHFNLQASARATPKVTQSALFPPLDMTLIARGDPRSVTLAKFRISSPAVQAELSDPIGLDRSGRLTTAAATLRVALDLAKVPGSVFGGKLNGQVMVAPARAGFPTAEFEFSGEDLTGHGFVVARANVGGRLRWPFLELEGAEFEFQDGFALGGKGRLDLESRRISDGQWHFHGTGVEAGWLRRLFPEGVACSNARASGRIGGSLDAPQHSGELTVEDFSAPHLKPCRLVAAWRGERLLLPEVTLRLESGTEEVQVAGEIRAGEGSDPSWRIDLKTLTLARDGQSLYRLEQPCRITARRDGPGGTNRVAQAWQIKAEGFRWIGDERGLTLEWDGAWPQRGRITLHGRGLAPADLADFISEPVSGALLTAVELSAEWDRGPARFQISGRGQFPALEERVLSAEVNLMGDTNGVFADPVIVSAEGLEILRAQGRMPFTLTPEPGRVRVRWDETKPFDFQAGTKPNQVFWDFVSRRLGVRISEPQVEARLQGTIEEVQGTLRATASGIGWAPSTNALKLPLMEKLRLEARFERDRIRLSEFAFQVEDQPVRVTGDLPVRQHFLRDFISTGALPDWRQSRVRVEIADARIEPFARYLPGVLSPQGRLTVGLDVVPGGDVNGELKIVGAATRPVPPLAPIRDIDATIQFAGRRATVSRFLGRMAGREVSVTGQFEVPESGTPQFELRCRGDNVPLVYRPGLLLRSDFDIQVAQAAGQAALISGDVTLRDGLYLQDLKALVPGGRSEVLSRPPYFSVAEKPFADWKLNLKVHGERFLRVRTPYFRGEISAAFQLKGNLEEPQALGEARINSGLVKFPFGTLDVDQGLVSLTSEHPYEPQLFATASSRLYGYNIRMELSGTAAAPFVSFTSTPPLTSEQILLMLAAGELPRDDMNISRGKKAGNFALYLGKDVVGRLLGSEDSADRLTVRSGEDVSEEGKSTYYIEYKLSEDWSVVAEYDRFNALNAGLKWKIFSR